MSTRRTGPNEIVQKVFVDDGGLNKVSDCAVVGDNLTATDMSTSSFDAGAGSVLRVRVSAPTYIAFADDDGKAALDAAILDIDYADSPCIELFASGTYEIACPLRWVRISAAPDRIELSID